MYAADTNIIIYYLDGDERVHALLQPIVETHLPIYVSGVTETELFGYASLTPKQIEDIERVLDICTVVHTNPRITRLAAELRRTYRVKTIDALIAATAVFTNSTLLTRNVRDFKHISDLSIRAV